MLLVVVVVAVLLDLMTEAKTGSSRSSRRRKSGRGERTGRRGRNRPEKMLLHNVQFQIQVNKPPMKKQVYNSGRNSVNKKQQ